MQSNNLTLKQMLTISHAIGVDLFKAVVSVKLSDKRLPKVYYRNYYNIHHTSTGFQEIKNLIDLGYMEEFTPSFYRVTKSGMEKFIEMYTKMAIYKSPKERDIAYLSHRINFYCEFYGYRFCDDNSSHVIDAFTRYYLKKERVSHTTGDVINQFKKELKYHFKQ